MNRPRVYLNLVIWRPGRVGPDMAHPAMTALASRRLGSCQRTRGGSITVVVVALFSDPKRWG